jgi:hypothetical protein
MVVMFEKCNVWFLNVSSAAWGLGTFIGEKYPSLTTRDLRACTTEVRHEIRERGVLVLLTVIFEFDSSSNEVTDEPHPPTTYQTALCHLFCPLQICCGFHPTTLCHLDDWLLPLQRESLIIPHRVEIADNIPR